MNGGDGDPSLGSIQPTEGEEGGGGGMRRGMKKKTLPSFPPSFPFPFPLAMDDSDGSISSSIIICNNGVNNISPLFFLLQRMLRVLKCLMMSPTKLN